MAWFDVGQYREACPPEVWASAREPVLLVSTSSTNDVARQLAHQGAVEGTLVVACQQWAGRGRLDRAWQSSPGGLWFSLVLRPGSDGSMLVLPLCVSVALAEGLEPFLPAPWPVRLKWPNDLLVGDKKLGGILLERYGEAVVVGMGVNVNQERFPASLESRATSLCRVSGSRWRLERILAGLLGCIHRRYRQLEAGGSPPILSAWRRQAVTLGQPVRVILPDRELEGTAVDIDEEGALWVQAGPDRVRVLAGDVTHLAAMTPQESPGSEGGCSCCLP